MSSNQHGVELLFKFSPVSKGLKNNEGLLGFLLVELCSNLIHSDAGSILMLNLFSLLSLRCLNL